MSTAKKLVGLLTPKERLHASLLVTMILIMALLDAVGIASIMPFIAVLTKPQIVQTNIFFAKLQQHLSITNSKDFLFILGLSVFALLVSSLAFKAFATYVQVRFTLMREYSLGQRLIDGYLHQPYIWFLNRHSVELGKTVLSEVSNVVHGVLVPFMTLIAQSAVALTLLILLFLVDPFLALSACATLGTSYCLIYKLTKKFLSGIGQQRFKANQQRFTAVNEVFSAVKEVKVSGLEDIYIKRFSQPAAIYAKNHAASHMVAQLPRYALEAVTFGGMLLIILYLMKRSGGLSSALPIIAVYALAGYRLMPALQQVYASFSQMRFARPALDALHKDLMSLHHKSQQEPCTEKQQLNQTIHLCNIEFSYPEATQPTLKNVNLKIAARSTIGLVGSTGSGKTTLADLILGLLEPQKGSLVVDGKIIDTGNCRKWQKSIGYVPQQIYLTDDTVAANIAFGTKPADIDWTALSRAAKIANLHNFVVNSLPSQYNTVVGERGVRLSGGQRQRIGIARALYHNPQVLILDEATSALDSLTEQAVMEAINNLRNDITIILIAHRLSTVRTCDQIVLLDNGEVKGQGTYTQLLQNNHIFRAMAAV